MTNSLPDAVQIVVDQAAAMMTVSTAESGDYDGLRQVMNARFDRRPTIIAMCENADHVSFWFRSADEVPELGAMSFVIRSGRHQHEGRSADGSDKERLVSTVVLDVSAIDEICKVDADRKMWVSTGAMLGDVVTKVSEAESELPVGACGNVRAGGLTQGGGWGMSWRWHGMTIDKLVAADIVTPDGMQHTVSGSDELFWGLRGGGGGNFGVVTRLQFQLSEQTSFIDFGLRWRNLSRMEAASTWAAILSDGDRLEDNRLDGFCRMAVVPPEGSARNDEVAPVNVRGWFRGTRTELIEVLAPLLKSEYGPILEVGSWSLDQAYALLSGSLDGSVTASALGQDVDFDPSAWAMQLGAPGVGGPESTCQGVGQRHKVSSGYPTDDPEALLRALADFFDAADGDELTDIANLYVSLHGMGGAAAADVDTAYSWRHKPFLAQIQAWWLGADNDAACLDWATRAASAIADVTEGAFISFPDEAQTLADYYDATTLVRLGHLKGAVDQHHRLKFPLSIEPIFGN